MARTVRRLALGCKCSTIQELVPHFAAIVGVLTRDVVRDLLLSGKRSHNSRVIRIPLILAPILAVAVTACDRTTPDRAVTTSAETNVVIPKVIWPASSKADARAFAALGDPARATDLVGRSPVPVLAPTSVTFERPTFVVGAEYYALTGRVAGATVAIQGTRAAHRHEDIAPIAGDRPLRGTRGFSSVNEGIRTTSWIENGVAYSVDIECADPTDERCVGEAFALDVVEHLAFVGGGAR